MPAIRCLSLIALSAAFAGCASEHASSRPDDAWRDHFDPAPSRLRDHGAGAYTNLTPGATWSYRDGEERLTIRVLSETQAVDGVTTRIVEEREEVGGRLKEISRNYFAIEENTGDLYYFGEDVDIYRNGTVATHDGAWRSGRDNARFGLLLPGSPRVGDRYYQEVAPGVALDRAEILSVTEHVSTPAGDFDQCVHIRETSPLEKGSSDKWFAPGVGLVRDGDLVLVSYALPAPMGR